MRRNYHGWMKTGVKWPNRIHSRVDAYPLVGLAVTLLVIFMVCPPIGTHGSTVDLPRTWHASPMPRADRKSTRLNSSHGYISYAVFCLKKKKKKKLHFYYKKKKKKKQKKI